MIGVLHCANDASEASEAKEKKEETGKSSAVSNERLCILIFIIDQNKR
jgi:hypothetical protein